jgi:uncharacterized membrane-anchored protein YjiN (DUF445 family)
MSLRRMLRGYLDRLREAPAWAIELRETQSQILELIDNLNERFDVMTETLDRATASLTRITDANQAVQKMISMFVSQVRDTGTDDPAVLAKLDEIDAQAGQITAAALANTPAAPSGGAGAGGPQSPSGV